jgi:hypothetical protein
MMGVEHEHTGIQESCQDHSPNSLCITEGCLAGKMEQRLLVVGSADLLVLLHKGRQVDVLLKELLVKLLGLLIQLCHRC